MARVTQASTEKNWTINGNVCRKRRDSAVGVGMKEDNHFFVMLEPTISALISFLGWGASVISAII